MCTGGEFNFETMPGAPKFIPLDVVERHAGEVRLPELVLKSV